MFHKIAQEYMGAVSVLDSHDDLTTDVAFEDKRMPT
jgi:hypothetical protein